MSVTVSQAWTGDAEVRRLRILYQLVSTLSRATELEDIYEAAIAALLSATEADRASILMFDEDGVMRFKAWRGLSQTYRDAVTGHTPWSKGALNARAIAVADALSDPELAAYRGVFTQEAIGALAFVPLALDGGVFGKFMLYYATPHTFTSDELEVAEAIAGHVALAAERKRSEVARLRSEQRLQAILDNSGTVVFVKDVQGRYVLINQLHEKLFHVAKRDVAGRTDFDLFPRETAERLVENDRQVLAAGTPLAMEEYVPHDDGVHTYLCVKFPIRESDRTISGICGIATDITERKQSEAAVRQLAAIVENSWDAIIGIDLAGRITSWNKSAERIFGYAASEALGQPILMLAPPVDVNAGREILGRVLRGEAVENHEMRRRRKDGGIVDVSLTASPVRDARGEIVGISGVARDITDRKRSELELARATRQLENILASIRESFIAVDREWRFTYVNDRVIQRTGMSREQLIGKNMWDLYPESLTPFWEGFRRCMQQRVPVQFEATYPAWSRSDEPRDYEVHAYPTDDGISVYILDITDRKKMEDSARQLAGIVEATSDFVAIARIKHDAAHTENSGGLVYLNRAGRGMLGLSADADISTLNQRSVYPAWVLTRMQQEWLPAALRDGSASGEGAVIGASGDEIPASFVVVAHPGSGGQPEYISTIARDITRRKQAEDRLRKANAELEEFAYVASHDLQEPLRNVNIYSQLLLKHVPEPGPEAADYAGFIREGVMRMDSLIRDLLSYSRVIHSDPEADVCADLSAALDQAIRNMKSRIEESGATVHAQPLPLVRGEAAHLEHVFQNLLSNSIKYRRQGVDPQIWISAEPRDDMWVITVRDNGIGFEQQYAERIFRLFQRLHKDEYDGTGLGLAICQRIIERYGGRIWAEGVAGKGAALFFTLPGPDGKCL